MVEFFQTGMGKRFYEHQLPTLIKEIGRLADAIEESNKLATENKTERENKDE